MSAISTPLTQLLPVARPYVGAEEEHAVAEVLRSGWLTQGPRVAEFESRFAEYVGCQHAIAVSSCTTALQLALLSLNIGPGDEVICPSLSFIATANSIVYVGATPVFCDIERDTFNIDPACIEACITPRTKAILLVHQIGHPAALHPILDIARKHGLAVVEDAACAIGSGYDGRRIGTPLGTLACFSFHPRKILTTGEGGMITTNDAALAERLRPLRQHAMSLSDVLRHNATDITTETYDEVGFNFRMTDMQAAVGLVQLQRLEGFLSHRRKLADRYTAGLQRLRWLQTPRTAAGCRHNYQSYMIRLVRGFEHRRDDLMRHLRARNISTRRGIMAIHREKPYQSAAWSDRLPVTELVTDTTLILPLFHQLTEPEQDYIIEAVADFN